MKLKELRKAKGVTQVELGKAIGATSRTVARWEAEQVDMPFKTAIKIAKFLGVSLVELAEKLEP
ncbi:helix-turn-helix transcriptional regulator [Streptococcus agalactiae]|uniref:helix-turn-helix transcriptional regulator n=1 Tax=Streptococcus agalactiae TaxID=1311 RepID=UPI00362E2340|nr:helix-turn-helix transcriptional regulator [Streptococcus agalactiae]